MSTYPILQYCVIEYLYVNIKCVISVWKSHYGIVIDFQRNIEGSGMAVELNIKRPISYSDYVLPEKSKRI